MLLAITALAAMADEVHTIVIEKNDGNSISIDITTLKSIKFADDVMLVNVTDGTQRSIAVADVIRMTFDSMATAINTIVGNESSDIISVIDLEGRVIYKGKAGLFNPGNEHNGIVIIKKDNKVYKVMIGGNK